MRSHMISGILPLLALIGCAPTPSEEGLDPQRVTVKIDREVSVIEPSKETGLAHEMLGMVRHPDGTIFVSTETQGTDAALGLFKSTDVGETWEALRVNLADVRGKQYLRGLGGTRDGRLWLLHQTASADLFVSSSSDGAHTWTTTPVEFTSLAPRAPKEPYVHSHNDYNTFIEQPDGTLMFSVGLRYDRGYYKDPEHLMEGLMRPDVDVGGEFMFRSTDGGKTWGDATLVHPHVTEVGHALGPNNPDRILSMTRTQRTLLAGEDREATIKKTGCPPDSPSDRLPRAPGHDLVGQQQRGGCFLRGGQPGEQAGHADQPGRRQDLGGRDQGWNSVTESIDQVRLPNRTSHGLLHRSHD